MAEITDLEDLARQHNAPDAETFTRRMAGRMNLAYLPDAVGEVRARLEHGRWLCDCPYCGGAELVSRAHGTFYCLSCGMADNGGHAMRVSWPEKRELIEELVTARPVVNRNWQPGETLTLLRRDNREHGIKGA